MDDWRNEKDYEKYERLKWQQYAWEFLRRNPEYKEEWKRFCTTSAIDTIYEEAGGDVAEIVTVKKQLDSTRLAGRWKLQRLIDPSLNYTETEVPWAVDCNHVVKLNEQNSASYISSMELGITGEEGPTTAPSRLVGVGFDVRLPIEPQLEAAGKILKKERQRHADFGEELSQRYSKHKRLCRTYLRILDAKTTGVDDTIAAPIILKNYDSTNRDAAQNTRMHGEMRDKAEAAERMMQEYHLLLSIQDR